MSRYLRPQCWTRFSPKYKGIGLELWRITIASAWNKYVYIWSGGCCCVWDVAVPVHMRWSKYVFSMVWQMPLSIFYYQMTSMYNVATWCGIKRMPLFILTLDRGYRVIYLFDNETNIKHKYGQNYHRNWKVNDTQPLVVHNNEIENIDLIVDTWHKLDNKSGYILSNVKFSIMIKTGCLKIKTSE